MTSACPACTTVPLSTGICATTPTTGEPTSATRSGLIRQPSVGLVTRGGVGVGVGVAGAVVTVSGVATAGGGMKAKASANVNASAVICALRRAGA
jgi:hypothetical protein